MRMLKIVKERNTLVRHLHDFFKVGVAIERLIYFIFIFFLLSHLNACLWYLIAKFDGVHPNSWIVENGFHDSSVTDVNFS